MVAKEVLHSLIASKANMHCSNYTIPQHFHQHLRWQATAVYGTILSAEPPIPPWLHVHAELNGAIEEDLSSGRCKLWNGISGWLHRRTMRRIVGRWGGTEGSGGHGCDNFVWESAFSKCMSRCYRRTEGFYRVCRWVLGRTSIISDRIHQRWDVLRMDGRPYMISTLCRALVSSTTSARPNYTVWHIAESKSMINLMNSRSNVW